MSGAETNLTADLVRKAAMKMRASIRHTPTQPPETDRSLSSRRRIETTVTETIFRGPDRANRRVEIALSHDDYKEDKGHGWLEIEHQSID